MKIQAVSGWKRATITPLPTPDISEYEDYFQRRNRRKFDISVHSKIVSPTALRRAVIMRKQGETWADIGRAVGFTGAAIRNAVDFLPYHLGIGASR